MEKRPSSLERKQKFLEEVVSDIKSQSFNQDEVLTSFQDIEFRFLKTSLAEKWDEAQTYAENKAVRYNSYVQYIDSLNKEETFTEEAVKFFKDKAEKWHNRQENNPYKNQ